MPGNDDLLEQSKRLGVSDRKLLQGRSGRKAYSRFAQASADPPDG